MKKFLILFALCLCGPAGLWAQTKTVSGKVISGDDNLPVIGATVRAKSHAKFGRLTDVNGKFSFDVPASEKTLVISYVGKQTMEVPAGRDLRIVLRNSSRKLDEVVVIGYGSGVKLGNTSASVVKVSSKQLEEKAVANPFDAIQGKVSGLKVLSSSGEPSEVSSISLHGHGSLGAGSAPLFVLDGVPVSAGTIQSMNPNDFESLQVLKDAAATSIYGARAANGVIYITTKKGRASKRDIITLRGHYGISNLASRRYYDGLMHTKDLLGFWQDAGLINKDKAAAILKAHPNVDTRWYDYYFMKNRPTYQADASISGGSEKVNYYVSAGLLDSKGLRYGSYYARYNFRTNVNAKVSRIMDLSLTNAITYDKARTNPYGQNSTNGGLSIMFAPYFSPYDEHGHDWYDREKIPGLGDHWSPRYLADIWPDHENTFTASNSGTMTLRPLKGLTLRSRVGMEYVVATGVETRFPSFKDSYRNGYRSRSYSRGLNWTFTNTAEYKFKPSDDHSFTLLAGHEFLDRHFESFSGSGAGLVDDGLVLLSSTTKDKKVSEGFAESAYLSFFGQFSYNYKSRYFLDLTARSDASSRFPEKHRTAGFWSVGLMWKAKKEAFLQDVDWLNDLKLKFSTGTSGNSAIGDYAARPLVAASGQYLEEPGLALGSPGNPDLTWEKQLKTTVGVDFRIFDRLDMDVEYYDRKTTSMLMAVPYPFTSGYSSLTKNVGTYVNRGVDIQASLDIWKNADRSNFFSAYLNYNYNADKVVSLFRGLDHWIIPNTGVCYVVGKPVMFFYPIFKQVNPDTGAPEWYLPGKNIAVTQKDDKKITNDFSDGLEQNTGVRRFAPVNGGFGFNAQFHGFTLDADFAFTWGKHIIVNDDFFIMQNPYMFKGYNRHEATRNFWKKKGDHSRFPSLDYRFLEFDTRLLKDASFTRLKNLTVGYVLPKSLLAKQNFIRGAKVYFTGRNLLTFTSFEGPDPEIDSNLTMGANPNTKEVSVGFELQL